MRSVLKMRPTICVAVILAMVTVSWSQETCYNSTQIDLIFLLDASTSIGHENWPKEIDYVIVFLEGFFLDLDDVRCGAVMFNKDSQKLFDLKTYPNPIQAVFALKGIPYPDIKGTNTHLALNQVLSYQMFSEASGGRDNVKDVVVVLTDGRPGQPDLTKKGVDRLQAAGISVIAVGVGHVSDEGLRGIGSQPVKVLTPEHHHLRDYIRETYQKTNCVVPPVVPCDSNTKADIVLLIDASSSIGHHNWQKQLKFISDMVQAFTIGPQDVLFGCVIFDREATKKFDLKTHTDKTSLSQALLNIRYRNIQGTRTDLGLSEIRTRRMFDTAAGGRDDARNIVIVFTDGQSNNALQTKYQADVLRDTGVTILSVGIEEFNLEELLNISSRVEYVYSSPKYEYIDFLKSSLVRSTCEDAHSVA